MNTNVTIDLSKLSLQSGWISRQIDFVLKATMSSSDSTWTAREVLSSSLALEIYEDCSQMISNFYDSTAQYSNQYIQVNNSDTYEAYRRINIQSYNWDNCNFTSLEILDNTQEMLQISWDKADDYWKYQYWWVTVHEDKLSEFRTIPINIRFTTDDGASQLWQTSITLTCLYYHIIARGYGTTQQVIVGDNLWDKCYFEFEAWESAGGEQNCPILYYEIINFNVSAAVQTTTVYPATQEKRVYLKDAYCTSPANYKFQMRAYLDSTYSTTGQYPHYLTYQYLKVLNCEEQDGTINWTPAFKDNSEQIYILQSQQSQQFKEIDLSLFVKETSCDGFLSYSLVDTNNDENTLLSLVTTTTHLRVAAVDIQSYRGIPFKVKMENLGGKTYYSEVKSFYSICQNQKWTDYSSGWNPIPTGNLLQCQCNLTTTIIDLSAPNATFIVNQPYQNYSFYPENFTSNSPCQEPMSFSIIDSSPEVKPDLNFQNGVYNVSLQEGTLSGNYTFRILCHFEGGATGQSELKTIYNACSNISYPVETTIQSETTILNGFKFFNFEFKSNAFSDCPVQNWTLIEIASNGTRHYPISVRKNGLRGGPDFKNGVCTILFNLGFHEVSLYLMTNYFGSSNENGWVSEQLKFTLVDPTVPDLDRPVPQFEDKLQDWKIKFENENIYDYFSPLAQNTESISLEDSGGLPVSFNHLANDSFHLSTLITEDQLGQTFSTLYTLRHNQYGEKAYSLKIIVTPGDQNDEIFYIPEDFHGLNQEELETKLGECKVEDICDAWNDTIKFFREAQEGKFKEFAVKLSFDILQDRLDRLRQIDQERISKLAKGTPSIVIKGPSMTGELEFLFSIDLVPPNHIQLIDYSKFIEFSIEFQAQDSESVQGQWIHKNESQQLIDRLQNKSDSPKRRLNDFQDTDFWWWVKKHDASSMSIQFLFMDPSKVSNSISDDVMTFKLKNPEFFQTKEGIFVAVTYYTISFPEQIIDEDQWNQIASQAKFTGNAATGFTLGSIVLGVNKQYIWSMLSSQQLVIYATNLNIQSPPMVRSFQMIQSDFAKIDNLSPEFIYKWLNFVESPPYNERLEQNGFESASISANLGSFMTFYVYFFAKAAVKLSMNYIIVRNARDPMMRKIGMLLGTNSLKYDILSFSISVYIEVFLPLVLQIHFMVKSGLKFSELMAGSGDIYNFILVIVATLLCLYFPFRIFLFIRYHIQKNFESTEEHMLTQIVFQDLNVNSEETMGLSYNFLQIIRRFLMVNLFLTFESLTIVPLGIYIFMNLFFLAVIASQKPFLEKEKNRIEFMNETIVYISILMYLPFIKETKDVSAFAGQLYIWFSIFAISLSILVTLAIQIRGCCIQKKYKDIRKQKKEDRDKQLALWKQQSMGDEFDQSIKDKIKLMEVQNEIAEYKVQRYWLIQNKIDFRDYPQEKEYRALLKSVDFENLIIKPRLIQYIKGPIRFKNVDNTCFMIAVIQILLANEDLKKHFFSNRYKSQYCLVMKRMYRLSSQSSFITNEIFDAKLLRKLAFYHFECNQQHDAQEYLMYLFDQLNKEMYSNQTLPVIEDKLIKSYTSKFNQIHNSVIDQLFMTLIQSSIQCQKEGCLHKITKFEQCINIIIPINESLEYCLGRYFSRNFDDVIHDYECRGCKEKSSGVRISKIIHHPQYMIFAIKRYKRNGQKINQNMEFPLQINLKQFTSKIGASQDTSYGLIGLVEHLGESLFEGHYIAYAKHSDNWFKFNDDQIEIINKSEVLNAKPYILLYKRGLADADDSQKEKKDSKEIKSTKVELKQQKKLFKLNKSKKNDDQEEKKDDPEDKDQSKRSQKQKKQLNEITMKSKKKTKPPVKELVTIEEDKEGETDESNPTKFKELRQNRKQIAALESQRNYLFKQLGQKSAARHFEHDPVGKLYEKAEIIRIGNQIELIQKEQEEIGFEQQHD